MGCMRTFTLVAAATLAFISACSPQQNWRQVTFEGTRLQAQLPCKPDRTQREVPLGGQPLQLAVAGCESGDAMVAVMTATLAPGMDVQNVLQGWQQATLQNLHADPSVHSEAWSRPGLLTLGAAQRLRAQGQRADGRSVTMQAVWGALTEGDRVRVVHAVVYAPQVPPALAQTLFDGVQP